MFWDQVPKTTCFFLEFSKFPKKPRVFQNSKIPKICGQVDNFFGILEFWKTRGFLEFWFHTSALQNISKSKAMRISQNIFGILENSVVCNVSASFVLNCLHLSIICFHLLIRSVHFLTRTSYLRTTFSLFSIHLSTYFCTHVVLLID